MTKHLDRRTVLRGMTTAAALLPVAQLAGCSGESPFTADAGSSDVDPNDAGFQDASGADASGLDAEVADSGTADEWATGGTASMSGNYPDPFADGMGAACSLTCAAVLGPCYVATEIRKDISEGQLGLPVRFAFLVVDEACNPIPDAEVDIWHTSATGFYSGSEAPDLCTLGDAGARAARYHRGIQITDAAGRADFDTCFPGWYSGRTIHIHFTVRANGQEYLTSQLYFEDALSDEIVNGQPVYQDRGVRDTTNVDDGLIPQAGQADFIFEAERQGDGAMLAWKTLVLRGSPQDPLC